MHNIGGSLFPNLAKALANLSQVGTLLLRRQFEEAAHIRKDAVVLTGDDRHPPSVAGPVRWETFMRPIIDVAATRRIPPEDLVVFGEHMAKLRRWAMPARDVAPDGRLVLVSAIHPTRSGAGKTTVAIGLAHGLQRAGQRVALALREPSLGPIFGIKGGGTGGGRADRRGPMSEITRGLEHLDHHVACVRLFGFEPVIAINRFAQDAEAELRAIEAGCAAREWTAARFTGFTDGGAGAEPLAQAVARETRSCRSSRSESPPATCSPCPGRS